jgi:outer membrane protein
MLPALAMAEDGQEKYNLGLGVGVGVSSSEYKEESDSVTPIPILKYEGEHFFVRGLTAGVHLYKDDYNELSLTVSYLSQSFDASESDSHAMQQLENRYSTMLAGAAYNLKMDWGVAGLSLSADVLGTSNGFIADASYAYPFEISFLKVKPSVGVEWTNENYNDYYYGVSASESHSSGLLEYNAESGISPYLGLQLKIGLTEGFGLTLGAKAKWLSDEITNSPMVDQDMKFSFGAGIVYSF